MCGKNDAKKDCLCQEGGWCAQNVQNVQNVQKETEKGPQKKGTKARIVKTAQVIYGTKTLVSCMEAVMRLHD